MDNKKYTLIGIPLDCGKTTKGCLMGPDAYRTAGIVEMISDLGHYVDDIGNIFPDKFEENNDSKNVTSKILNLKIEEECIKIFLVLD